MREKVSLKINQHGCENRKPGTHTSGLSARPPLNKPVTSILSCEIEMAQDDCDELVLYPEEWA